MRAATMEDRPRFGVFCLLALATILPSALAAKSDPIIVIGAGASGLSTAKELKASGYTDVTILESRDVFGGRVRTVYKFGFPTEVGANWIHGLSPQNVLYGLAKKTKAVTHYSGETIEVFEGGKKLSETESYAEFYDAVLAKVNDLMQNADKDIALDEAVQLAIAALGVRMSRRGSRVLNAFLEWSETDGANSLKNLSAWWYDDSLNLPGGDHFVLTGYINLIKPLAEGLKIEYNSAVTRVEVKAPGKVLVTVTNFETGKKSVRQAAAVVVTVPLGVLKKKVIQFVPALPGAIKGAISRLGFGVFDRLFLHYDSLPRKTNSEWIAIGSDTVGNMNMVLDVNWYTEGRNVLVCLLAGDYALETESWTDKKLLQVTLDRLRKQVPEFKNLPNPKNFYRTKWGQDGNSCGSYSSYNLGSSPNDVAAFSTPIKNSLFFAGEHTHRRYMSTVHGAIYSGQRAAKQVHAALSK